jgi:uncharacterized protein (TIGR00255 family)
MTGIGTGRAKIDDLSLQLELRSVNHRFLDLSLRLPPALSDLEPHLRQRIAAVVDRGRITVNAELESQVSRLEVEFDRVALEEFLSSARRLARDLDVEDDLRLSSLVNVEGIFRRREKEIPRKRREELLDRALEQALERFQRMREKEGGKLARDLGRRLTRVEKELAIVRRRSQGMGRELRERLEHRLRLAEAKDAVDPQRLAAEVALLVDRATISEEVERLESHLGQFRESLASEDPVAKRLGFLLQEMHREVNTTGSKAVQIEVTHAVVRMKEELESMREQIQNLE